MYNDADSVPAGYREAQNALYGASLTRVLDAGSYSGRKSDLCAGATANGDRRSGKRSYRPVSPPARHIGLPAQAALGLIVTCSKGQSRGGKPPI